MPTLLASALEPDASSWPSIRHWLAAARDAEAIYHDPPRGFTPAERASLRDFFAAALGSTVHGPRPDDALELLECAGAFEAHVPDVVRAWLGLDDIDAEGALVRAIATCAASGQHRLAFAALFREEVRSHLEQRFLGEPDHARRAALSVAESTVNALRDG